MTDIPYECPNCGHCMKRKDDTIDNFGVLVHCDTGKVECEPT